MALDSRAISTVGSFFAEPWTRFAMGYVGLCLVALYLGCIYWTLRDAERRIANPLFAYVLGSLALLPYFGLLLYLIVRPRETNADARTAERWRAVRRNAVPVRRAQRPRDRTTHAGGHARAA